MISVMLVDDHPVIRQGLRALLEAEPDIQVIGEAGDGLEALRMVAELSPRVIVLDLMMKGISGIEVARQLNRSSTTTAIVIFSMLGSEHHVLEALRAGVRGYVLKESPSDELVKAIREVAAGNRYLSAVLSEQPYLQSLTGSNSSYIYSRLTSREQQILELSAQGSTCAEIAQQLSISRRTVEAHRANMMRKLGMSNPAALHYYAFQQGIPFKA
ncbi:MAG: response regulator transcription factor [Chloroflexota bacterium]